MILRIRLGDIRESYASFSKVFAQRLHHTIGLSIHRLVHRNLQDQVSASLEVEAEMNVLLDGANWTLPLPGVNCFPRISAQEDAVHKHQQHGDDEKCFR